MQLPAWIEEEPEHLRVLLIELHWVRHRGMRGLATSAPIPELVDLATTKSPKTSPQRQRQLMTVLLEKVLMVRLEEQDKEAVPLYFGIAPETWSSTERQRREKTASMVFHQGFSTFLKPDTGAERPFLVRLATTLYELSQSALDAEELLSFTTPYVDRLEYHDTFEALITQGHKLIAFVGEPGNGKSRLAFELVAKRMRETDSRIVLKAHNTTTLMTDVAGALQNHVANKVGTYPTADDALARAFAALISSPDAPTYVIIDNAEDSQLVDRLVPSSARSTVVVTSRENMLPSDRGKSLTVGVMEDDEARQFARFLLPMADDTDISWLIGTLGNRPLAIDHACTGLLADGHMTIEEFRTAFDRRAATVMKQAKRPAEQSLPFVYEQIIARLRAADIRYDTKAATLLELVAFVASEAIPPELLRKGLVASSPPEDASLAPVEFQSAQRELQRLHLIQQKADGLAIHQFTQTILRDLLRDREQQTCLLLHRVLAEELKDIEPGGVLPKSAIARLPHASNILLGLTKVDPTRRADEGFGRTFSILAHGLRQSGNRDEYLAFITRYFPIAESEWQPGQVDHFVWEFWDDAYNAGHAGRFEYAESVLQKLMREYDTSDLANLDFNSDLFIKVLELTLLTYRYDHTVGLVKEYIEKINRDPGATVVLSPDVFRLMGDALAAKAVWDFALENYGIALHICDQGSQNLDLVRAKFITHMHMANTALEAGNVSLAKEQLRSLYTLNDETENDYVDSLIIAAQERIIARAKTVIAIFDTSSGRESSATDAGIDAIYDAAFLHHDAMMLGRYLLAVKYDWGCYRLLRGEVAEVRHVFHEQAAVARRLQERDIAFLYHLGLIKLRIIEGSSSLRDIHRSLRIGRRFLDECQMPNRHADAVGTAYVVAVTCKAPQHVVDSLRESTRSAYAAIAKDWKFELLDRVGGKEFNPLALMLP